MIARPTFRSTVFTIEHPDGRVKSTARYAFRSPGRYNPATVLGDPAAAERYLSLFFRI